MRSNFNTTFIIRMIRRSKKKVVNTQKEIYFNFAFTNPTVNIINIVQG